MCIRDRLRVEEYDRQIQFAGKAFGAGQDGGILVQEVRPVVLFDLFCLQVSVRAQTA